MNDTLIHECNFCLYLREKKGGCSFAKGTKCENCAALYVMWKVATGELIHEKLTFEERKKKLQNYKE